MFKQIVESEVNTDLWSCTLILVVESDKSNKRLIETLKMRINSGVRPLFYNITPEIATFDKTIFDTSKLKQELPSIAKSLGKQAIPLRMNLGEEEPSETRRQAFLTKKYILRVRDAMINDLLLGKKVSAKTTAAVEVSGNEKGKSSPKAKDPKSDKRASTSSKRQSTGGKRKSMGAKRQSTGGKRKSMGAKRKSMGGKRKSMGGKRKSMGGQPKSTPGERKSSSGGTKESTGQSATVLTQKDEIAPEIKTDEPEMGPNAYFVLTEAYNPYLPEQLINMKVPLVCVMGVGEDPANIPPIGPIEEPPSEVEPDKSQKSKAAVDSSSGASIGGKKKSISGGGRKSLAGKKKSISGGGRKSLAGKKKSISGGGRKSLAGKKKSISGGGRKSLAGKKKSISGGGRKSLAGAKKSISGGGRMSISGGGKRRSGSGSVGPKKPLGALDSSTLFWGKFNYELLDPVVKSALKETVITYYKEKTEADLLPPLNAESSNVEQTEESLGVSSAKKMSSESPDGKIDAVFDIIKEFPQYFHFYKNTKMNYVPIEKPLPVDDGMQVQNKYHSLMLLVPNEDITLEYMLFAMVEHVSLLTESPSDADILNSDEMSKRNCKSLVLHDNDYIALKTLHLDIPGINFNKIHLNIYENMPYAKLSKSRTADNVWGRSHMHKYWRLANSYIPLDVFQVTVHQLQFLKMFNICCDPVNASGLKKVEDFKISEPLFSKIKGVNIEFTSELLKLRKLVECIDILSLFEFPLHDEALLLYNCIKKMKKNELLQSLQKSFTEMPVMQYQYYVPSDEYLFWFRKPLDLYENYSYQRRGTLETRVGFSDFHNYVRQEKAWWLHHQEEAIQKTNAEEKVEFLQKLTQAQNEIRSGVVVKEEEKQHVPLRKPEILEDGVFPVYDSGDFHIRTDEKETTFHSIDGQSITVKTSKWVQEKDELLSVIVNSPNAVFVHHRVIPSANSAPRTDEKVTLSVETKSGNRLIYTTVAKGDSEKLGTIMEETSRGTGRNMTNSDPYNLHISTPKGLNVSFHKTDYCRYVKQQYSSEMIPSPVPDENLRLYLQDGSVIVYMNSGIIYVYNPDSSYVKIYEVKQVSKIITEAIESNKPSLGADPKRIEKQAGEENQSSGKRQSVKRQSVKRQSVKRQSVKRQSVKRKSMKRQSVKRQSMKRGSIKKPSSKPAGGTKGGTKTSESAPTGPSGTQASATQASVTRPPRMKTYIVQYYDITKYDVIGCLGKETNYVESTKESEDPLKYRMRSAVNEKGQLYVKRADGTNSFFKENGKLFVKYPDGTLISSLPYVLDENLLLDDAPAQEDNYQSESRAESIDKESKGDMAFAHYGINYVMEHPQYARVQFNNETVSIAIPDSTEIVSTQETTYLINFNNSTNLELSPDLVKIHTHEKQMHKETCSELSFPSGIVKTEKKQILKTVDSLDREFTVYTDGSTEYLYPDKDNANVKYNIDQFNKFFVVDSELNGYEFLAQPEPNTERIIGAQSNIDKAQLYHLPVLTPIFSDEKRKHLVEYMDSGYRPDNMMRKALSPYLNFPQDSWLLNNEPIRDPEPEEPEPLDISTTQIPIATLYSTLSTILTPQFRILNVLKKALENYTVFHLSLFKKYAKYLSIYDKNYVDTIGELPHPTIDVSLFIKLKSSTSFENIIFGSNTNLLPGTGEEIEKEYLKYIVL